MIVLFFSIKNVKKEEAGREAWHSETDSPKNKKEKKRKEYFSFRRKERNKEERSHLTPKKKKDFFSFRERGREGVWEGEKHGCEGETLFSCLLYAPGPGAKPAPRHVPGREIQLAAFQFGGWSPTDWATLIRAKWIFFLATKIVVIRYSRNRKSIQKPWLWN